MEEKNKNKSKNKTVKFILILLLVILIIFTLSIYISINNTYNEAMKSCESKDYKKATELYEKILFYKDVKERKKEAYYNLAIQLKNDEQFDKSIKYLQDLNDYKDSKEQLMEAKYQQALYNYQNKNFKQSKEIFEEIQEYKDSKEQLKELNYQYAIYNYENGKFEEAKNVFKEIEKIRDVQEYLNNIEIFLKLQGIWECKTSIIQIENNVLKSYSCFGTGNSPLYKYSINNSKYFKVENRTGKIKLENNNIKVYDDKNSEITSMCLEWNNKNNEIISYLNSEHLYPSIYSKKDYEIIEIKGIKEPSIGMTKAEVEASTWGKPEDINKTTTKYGTREQWCYSGYKYVYFEDGVVTSIQD